jgi:hypothetical protein
VVFQKFLASLKARSRMAKSEIRERRLLLLARAGAEVGMSEAYMSGLQPSDSRRSDT